MFKITILGPVGQKIDAEYITLEYFNLMVKHSEDIINEKIGSKQISGWNNIQLYTTGAPFSEYIAVVLAIKYKCHIFFCMGCSFDLQSQRFINTESLTQSNKIDKILNSIHQYFFDKTGIDTLKQISEIMYSEKCQSFYFKEFLNIHKFLCKCNFLVLFNFGNVPMNKSYSHLIYKQFKFDKICVILEKIQ